MENSFVRAMQTENNVTYTENGAKALKSTKSDLVDLFGVFGSLRSRPLSEIERLFSKAYSEDALLATKMAFYGRNVRGGLGEKRTSKAILKYLAMTKPEVMRKNMVYVPSFGRWDDLYEFVGTPVEKDMWELVRVQLTEDVAAYNRFQETGKVESISLLAKWLKSVNASKKETVKLGRLTAKALKMSEKEYRQTLSLLRKYLGVVEVSMSSKDWDSIKYSGVTSKAMTIYRNAFMKHDPVGFEAYKQSLVKGETTVNASTLYPYDILRSYGLDTYGRHMKMSKQYDIILEEQWKALPNYVEGENNILVMADTSGSMTGEGGVPMYTSVGLAMYFAERNKGVFANTFMTFSSDPQFVTLKGDTLRDRVTSIESIVADTNLERGFKMVLDVAVKNNIPVEDMPKAIVIITDGEFNSMVSGAGRHNTYYAGISEMYERAGYPVPTITFWNVASRQDRFHAFSDQKGVQMVSGHSPATFKTVLANLGVTPWEAMVNTLNAPEYSMITV